MEDDLIKLIVIGDSLVGKTSFIHRYVNNTFRPEYKSTIGVDFALKIINWKNNVKVKLQLWDIAGQERFTFMTRAYYKDAKGCLLLFDLTKASTFEKVKKWKTDLDSKVRQSDGSLLPCLLVGNKADLTDRQVDKSQITELCQEMKFIGWTETSAKDGVMINEAIRYIIDVIMGASSSSKNTSSKNELMESVRLRSDSSVTKKNPKCNC